MNKLLLVIFITVQLFAEYPQTINWYGHGYSVPHDFSTEQYQYISDRYPIFTVEKRHAYLDYGGSPSSEQATIGTSAKIKTIHPAAKVLVYWNSILNYNLYESQKVLAGHPDWIYGKDTLGSGMILDLYDLNNPDLQNWWIDSLCSIISRGNLDGVFLDAVPKIPVSMLESFRGMIDRVRAKIGSEKLVIYNGFRMTTNSSMAGDSTVLTHCSGVYVEAFFSGSVKSKEMGTYLLDRLIESEQIGKIIIARGSPFDFWGTTQENPLFDLACYLLFYGPNSYFTYNWGYASTEGLFSPTIYDSLKIGKPLGRAIRTGFLYQREFEQLSVTVDLEQKTASIVPKGTSIVPVQVVSVLPVSVSSIVNGIQLSNSSEQSIQFELFRLNGSKIMEGSVKPAERELIHASAGCYLVTLHLERGVVTQKVTVAR